MSAPIWIAGSIPFLNANLNNFKYWKNPVLEPGAAGSWDEMGIGRLAAIRVARADWHMWYSGISATGAEAIGYARSTDGLHWERVQDPPVLVAGEPWEGNFLDVSSVVLNKDTFHLYYWSPGHLTPPAIKRIGLATSVDGINWTKHGVVLDADPGILNESPGKGGTGVDAAKVLYIDEEDRWLMVFTAFGPMAVWNGLAESKDGIHWKKIRAPLCLPDGCFDRKDVGYRQATIRGVMRVGTAWVALSSAGGSDRSEVFLPAVADSLDEWHRFGAPIVYTIPDGQQAVSVLAAVPADDWIYVFYTYTPENAAGKRYLGVITAPRLAVTQPVVLWQDAKLDREWLLSKVVDVGCRRGTLYLKSAGAADVEVLLLCPDRTWSLLDSLTVDGKQIVTYNLNHCLGCIRLRARAEPPGPTITGFVAVACT